MLEGSKCAQISKARGEGGVFSAHKNDKRAADTLQELPTHEIPETREQSKGEQTLVCRVPSLRAFGSMFQKHQLVSTITLGSSLAMTTLAFSENEAMGQIYPWDRFLVRVTPNVAAVSVFTLAPFHLFAMLTTEKDVIKISRPKYRMKIIRRFLLHLFSRSLGLDRCR